MTNYLGLGAAGVLIILLLLSNDASLRKLGPDRWKALQRSAYVAFGLMVIHGVAYQMLERRIWPWGVAFGATVTLVAGSQTVAVRRWRTNRK